MRLLVRFSICGVECQTRFDFLQEEKCPGLSLKVYNQF